MPFAQAMTAGCCPLLMAGMIETTLISDVDPLQLGSITTVLPVARLMAPCAAGVAKSSAPVVNDGRNWALATPISTPPLRSGAPVVSWLIMASYAVLNCAGVLTIGWKSPESAG